MARTLFLHIGCHKTGTTAIQHAAIHNRDFLRKHGWHFAPGPHGAVNWGNAFGFSKLGQKPTFWIKDDFLDLFESALSQEAGNAILSAEDLFFLEEEQINQFAQRIAPLFDKITICAYLRRQDDLAISQKAQGAKTIQSALLFGLGPGAFPKLTSEVNQYLDFSRKLTLWARAFPDATLSVREYLRTRLKGGDIVKDFFAQLGLNLNGDAKDVNPSLGANQVQFLLKLRSHGFKQSEIHRILNYGWIAPCFTPSTLTTTRQEAQDFLSHFAQSNKKLPRILGKDFTFYREFSAYPEVAQNTNYDEYERENLFTLVTTLGKFFEMEKVHKLRDTALRLEKSHPHLATGLSEMALEMHPTGPVLAKLYNRLHQNEKLA